ncbi:Methyltransferase-like protein 17, mitochondrial [Cyanidiococcus yangmingshanensis]|uniref:Methyltransferase-like protein 17, mitochondrial n=1 Tax=Cyanidiococcus yangmingshanensis TaxID=2690220 RepID=A0A7J7IPM8_9RHOD|nr:Methyltransferase-like protein 17, mitochondrial [Cyanidiococcus yangmingshanensis]
MGVLAALATWPSRELCSTVFDANPTRRAASRAWLGDRVESCSYLEPNSMYDLITAVHCRSEGSASERSMAFFENLWRHCRGALVIVEPGNADGFTQMTAVRSHLLQLHGSSITVAAPCPHSGPCPLNAKEGASLTDTGPNAGFRHGFCHFTQRYEREGTLRQMSFIDHANRMVMPSSQSQATRRFSYVVLERVRQGDEASPATEMRRFQARILREPLKRNGHVVLYLCQENQRIERHTYTRRKHADGTYRHARRASWGDEWTHPVTAAGLLVPSQASPSLTRPSPTMDRTDPVDDSELDASTKTTTVATFAP